MANAHQTITVYKHRPSGKPEFYSSCQPYDLIALVSIGGVIPTPQHSPGKLGVFCKVSNQKRSSHFENFFFNSTSKVLLKIIFHQQPLICAKAQIFICCFKAKTDKFQTFFQRTSFNTISKNPSHAQNIMLTSRRFFLIGILDSLQ